MNRNHGLSLADSGANSSQTTKQRVHDLLAQVASLQEKLEAENQDLKEKLGVSETSRLQLSRRHYELQYATFELISNPMPPPDEDGVTILHRAAEKGTLEIVNHIIACKPGYLNYSDKDSNGTPLHWAVRRGKIEIVDALLNEGAEVNSFDEVRATPLHEAADWGRLEIAKALLRKGADIEARTVFNETPLHYAVEHQYLDVATFLVNNGANVNIRGFRGTPLDIAKGGKYDRISEYLESRGGTTTDTRRAQR